MYPRRMNEPETKRLGVAEARQNLTEVVSQVRLLGEHVTLTRREKPQAVVVPMDWYERATEALKGA